MENGSHDGFAAKGLPFRNNTGNTNPSHILIKLTWKTVIPHTNMVEMSWVENKKSNTNKSKRSR